MGINKQNNPHKGMRLISMWLTSTEEKSLKKSIKAVEELSIEDDGQKIIDIFEEINKRGDLQWTK